MPWHDILGIRHRGGLHGMYIYPDNGQIIRIFLGQVGKWDNTYRAFATECNYLIWIVFL